MTIVVAPPLEGKRTSLCEGSEAVVFKLRTKAGVLVERLQKPTTDGRFAFSLGVGFEVRVYDISSLYHVYKFQALRLGRAMFPDHFVNVRRLHLSDGGYLTYSDLVPDETGVIARIADARRRFASMDSDEEKKKIRRHAEHIEHSLAPGLASIVQRLADAGLIIAHPEANYHITGGKIVFFEVANLDLMLAATHVFENMPDNEDARNNLALIHATALKLDSYHLSLEELFAHLVPGYSGEIPAHKLSSLHFMPTLLKPATTAVMPYPIDAGIFGFM
ncbi:hypothetical protein KKB44_02055 [Candidatus Micrarchaeota archaeon]|nr:hypothetical protein [Candidatus Micrarchaeota archaeon]